MVQLDDDDDDRKVDGSTPTLASLLRPWIRRFTIIISAWWKLASSKLSPKRVWIRPMYMSFYFVK